MYFVRSMLFSLAWWHAKKKNNTIHFPLLLAWFGWTFPLLMQSGAAKPCCLSNIKTHQYKISFLASTSDFVDSSATPPPPAVRKTHRMVWSEQGGWGWFLSNANCRFIQLISDIHVRWLHSVTCPLNLISICADIFHTHAYQHGLTKHT